jgi:hypothetical protein
MKMNPTRFLALSLMALTMTPTASGQVRGTKKTTVRPTATTCIRQSEAHQGKFVRPTDSSGTYILPPRARRGSFSHLLLLPVRCQNTFNAPTAPPTAKLCVVGSACPSKLNNKYEDDSAGKSCPEICTMEYCPVVGCDGSTYSNACVAQVNGVSVSEECVI